MKHVKTKMLGLLAVVLLVAVGGCYKTIECWEVMKCYLVYKGNDSFIECGNYIDITQENSSTKQYIDSGYLVELLSDTSIRSMVNLRLVEVNGFKREYGKYCK